MKKWKWLFLVFWVSIWGLHINACAEPTWGGLPLTPVDHQKYMETTKETIVNLRLLTSVEELKVGKIAFVDLSGDTAMVIDDYHGLLEIWILDIQKGFQYGYEIELCYNAASGTYRNCFLAEDGTALYWLGRDSPVLGLSAGNGEIQVDVYKAPFLLRNLQFERPKRSNYVCTEYSKGRVTVASDQESKVLFDFSAQSNEYIRAENARAIPGFISYLICVILLIAGGLYMLIIHRKKRGENFPEIGDI